MSRTGGSSSLRETIRSVVPLSTRARLMRAMRRIVLGAASPPPGVAIGGIDVASTEAAFGDGVLRVVGWALRDGRMPSTVEVRLDGVLLGRARLGLGRPDLPPLGPDTLIAGFEAVAPLPGPVGRAGARVTAVAHFEGGRHRHVIEGPRVTAWVGAGTAAWRRTASPARATPGGRTGVGSGAVHVLVVTHQLDLGGGQLYAQDLIRGLLRGGDLRVTVASPVGGPLADELESLGVCVHPLAAWPHDSLRALEARVEEVSAWAREAAVAAVVANTSMAFPAVHVAARLGVPSIWAIHESYPLAVLGHAMFGPDTDAGVRDSALEAMRIADRLVFEADATRAVYAPAAGAERCLLVPYGIEVATLDTRRAGLSRAAARRALRVPPDARVLLCMGTFQPRKAQTLLVRAFSGVADRHPSAVLVLVGDNGSEYANTVRRLAATTGLGRRIRLEPVGPDIVPWYVAADVLVSASDVESMPRSALEAMALGTPVLAADVYGLGELVDDGVSGWLVAERDLDALAAGLDRVLGASPADLAEVAAEAAARARRDHDASGYVAAYRELLGELLGAPGLAPVPKAGT